MKGPALQLQTLSERFSDPLLTALTGMLAILLFVVSPLQAAGIISAHHFGFAFGLLLLVAVFIVSRSATAVAAIVVSIALLFLATILRLRHPSLLDIWLDAS